MKSYDKLKEVSYYIFAAAIALSVYFLLNRNIEIALRPHALIMQLLYQMQFEFLPGLGYREVNGLFIISGECSGAKLFVCLFFIFITCCLRRYRGFFKKLFMLFSFCFASIALSYAITAIRIASSIPFCGSPDFKLIHTMLSLILYFGSGLLLYAFLNRSKQKGETDFEEYK